MQPEELLKLVNEKYLERKSKMYHLEYQAPEQIVQIKVQSDQVKALIDVIAPMINI